MMSFAVWLSMGVFVCYMLSVLFFFLKEYGAAVALLLLSVLPAVVWGITQTIKLFITP